LLDIIAHHDNSPSGHSDIACGGRIDIDSFDLAKIDQLIAEKSIGVPQSWESWSLSTRIAWLKLQLEAAPGPLALADSGNFRGQQSQFAKPKAKSRVSLMTSLAALANPIEGEIIEGDETLFPAVVAWGSKADGVAVSEESQGDPLRRVVDEIDGLDERQALAAVGKLTSQSEATLFRLGGVLARLKTRGWRKTYPSFKAFVEAEHDISYSTATRWMAIYRHLAESGITWERAQAVGWGKLKEIAGVITPDNADEWIAIASENTAAKLARIVARHKAGALRAIEHKTGEPVSRMTVTLKAGEREAVRAAIEKAKAEAGAEAAGGALETICANYVSGETLKHEAKAMGLEACLRVIEAAYPNAKLKVAFVEETHPA
jgi:hypothetical protein